MISTLRIWWSAIMVGAVLLAVALLAGCASSSLQSETMPGVALANLHTFHVRKLAQDGRRIDQLISDRLNAMGKSSTYGPGTPTSPVDAIVTYQDRWMWDITMYMLELNIQLRDPKNEVQLASGHTLRTSLVRRSPQEMVDEVLGKMFGIAPPATPKPTKEN